jgi:hypothetical protein
VEPLGGSENAIKTLPDALLLHFRSEKASGWSWGFGQDSFGWRYFLSLQRKDTSAVAGSHP